MRKVFFNSSKSDSKGKILSIYVILIKVVVRTLKTLTFQGFSNIKSLRKLHIKFKFQSETN